MTEPLIPHGLRNAVNLGGGWFIHIYDGNPLGHQYGGAFRVLAHHHKTNEFDGAQVYDPHKCDDRYAEAYKGFDEKMRELGYDLR